MLDILTSRPNGRSVWLDMRGVVWRQGAVLIQLYRAWRTQLDLNAKLQHSSCEQSGKWVSPFNPS